MVMINVSDRICIENQNTYCISIFFFENHVVYKIISINIIVPGRLQMTVQYDTSKISCWMPKATNTRSEYVIIIVFPLKQWLHERASILRYTYVYIACVVYFNPLNAES